MDLESEHPVLVSVEDHEDFENGSLLGNLETNGNSKVQNNGFREVENNDHDKVFTHVNGKVTEDSEPVSSPPAEMKSGVSPSSSTKTRKGYGLKKWRRIRRDSSKGGESSADTGQMEMQDLQNSVVKPKRMHIYAEKQQKSEGSVSSTNAVIGGLDVFALLGDSGLAMGPSVDVGTDSENSEDRSSKSSTAASFPKMKCEIPVVVGFPQDKMRMRSLSGKNLTHSVQRGQQGKGRIEAIKKAKGERVKIEKENSQSSLESDSRSSNFVFSQGPYVTSNGVKSERPVHHDGENGDKVHGSQGRLNDGHLGGYSRNNEGGYEEIPPEEDEVADLSWEVKKDRSENHDSSSDQDPLVESIYLLQDAQEALEKEVLKFNEINEDASVDDSGEGVQSFHQAVQSELVEIAANRVVETEIEELFRQRIEAEVEFLAISRTVQKLRVAAIDSNTVLEEHKSPAQMVNSLEVTENKAEKLEKFSEDIAIANETLKLRKGACKYASCFLLQLLLLLIVLGIFVFRLSPNSLEVVPT